MKIRSPGRSWPGVIRAPCPAASQSRCAPAVRGRVSPACRYAAWVNPEQSQAWGPLAPKTYASPVWLVAHAMTRATAASSIGGLAGSPSPVVSQAVGSPRTVPPPYLLCVVEDVVDVPVGVVVREQRPPHPVGAFGDP